MADYVTLDEIYVYNPTLFKTKNLKGFLKAHKVQEDDMVKLKANTIGLSKTWIKKNLASFNLKLTELSDKESIDFFEVQQTLAKYGVKNFNPINLKVDSTMVKYFLKDGKRTPYFTRKGLIKIMVLFNSLPSNIFNWIDELINGRLQSQTNNLNNVTEMVTSSHIPFVKNIDGDLVISDHIYNITDDDIIVDFKRAADLKKETNLKQKIEDYKCPIFTQLQLKYKKGLKEAQENYNQKLKELTQEKVIQHLQLELEKEKSLKDQAISLTQSFIPNFVNGDVKPSLSPPPKKTLKPSKVQ